MSDADTLDATPEALSRNWFWFFALGVLMIIGGALALYAPFEASLAVELVIGAFLLGGGVVALVQTFFMEDGWKARLIHLAIAVVHTLAGAVLLFRPLEGVLALTLIVIINMFVSGCMRIFLGFQTKPEKGWGWIVAGGTVSGVAAVYLFSGYPGISLVLLGVFAGISLIAEGVGYIMLAFGVRPLVATE